MRLIDQPRGRDISPNYDVESRGYVIPVRGGILCSLCGSPVCAAIDRIVVWFCDTQSRGYVTTNSEQLTEATTPFLL